MELNPTYASDAADASPMMTIVPIDEKREPDTLKTATVNLDHSGDIILKVGDKSLLVSSKILTIASPVFRAMFGPHFQEGEALSRR